MILNYICYRKVCVDRIQEAGIIWILVSLTEIHLNLYFKIYGFDIPRALQM